MPQIHKVNKSIKCFVCEKAIQDNEVKYHTKVNMPVCEKCNGSEKEKLKAAQLLDGLAEGFVCGCI
ncbi:hypothetical protein [Carboxylicivirga marina]|uniref:Uncharacterized protein n=1 Tax=Carboxylicivirga marina TaxID=2800988 RepID=A0ABS1HP93_9BACT|nr:hypothetical protein [Carboxylicivirga marina]MBK3519058.1 hypothetical protein [Carboxylicivirga marina]